MKRFVATVAMAAALLVPAGVTQAASETDSHVIGTRPCSTPYTGWIFYYVDPLTGQQVDLFALCIEIGE